MPRCGKDHGGHGGDQQQHDDPRLRQADVGGDRVAERAAGRRRRVVLGLEAGVRREPRRAPRAAGTTVASATSVAQISDRQRHVQHDRPRPQARRARSARPTTIWPTNSASASVDSTTRSFDRARHGARADRDPQHEQEHAGGQDAVREHRRSPPPPSAGTSRPSISGQSREREPAPMRARTYVPTSSSAPVAPTVAQREPRRSRRRLRSPPGARAGASRRRTRSPPRR